MTQSKLFAMRSLFRGVNMVNSLNNTNKSVKNVTIFSSSKKYFHNQVEKNVIKSKHSNIEVPNCTVAEYIWRNLDKWPDKIALTCGVTGKSYTYAKTEKMCTAFAVSLRNKLKLVDGDCVALILPNCPEFPIAAIGAIQAGCIVSTVNPMYNAAEIARQLESSEAKVIITLSSCYEEVKKALENLQLNRPVILTDAKSGLPKGTIEFNEFATNFHESTDCLKSVKRTADDTVFLPYSSGTVGLPKGVELMNRNILANFLQETTEKVTMAYPAIGKHQDILLSILPFFHIYGLVITLLSKLHIGAQIVTLPKFTPDGYLNAQEKYKSNSLYLVPPIALFLAAHPNVKDVHLDPVQAVMSGAAPLADSDVHRFLKRIKGNVSFMQGFGMTETSPAVIIQERGATNYASVGGPLPNTELKIVDLDDDNKNLGPNQNGELWVRGPQVMKGYLKNPEANQEVFRPGNWLRTGDMAYYDENHDFYITDRLKELIKVKAYQVAPAELEGILRGHPDLADVVVVGASHPQYGEIPKAFVVKKAGTSPTAESIMDFVAEKVSSYKKLGDVIFIEAVPKSAAGKILRKQVKAQFGKYL